MSKEAGKVKWNIIHGVVNVMPARKAVELVQKACSALINTCLLGSLQAAIETYVIAAYGHELSVVIAAIGRSCVTKAKGRF